MELKYSTLNCCYWKMLSINSIKTGVWCDENHMDYSFKQCSICIYKLFSYFNPPALSSSCTFSHALRKPLQVTHSLTFPEWLTVWWMLLFSSSTSWTIMCCACAKERYLWARERTTILWLSKGRSLLRAKSRLSALPSLTCPVAIRLRLTQYSVYMWRVQQQHRVAMKRSNTFHDT